MGWIKVSIAICSTVWIACVAWYAFEGHHQAAADAAERATRVEHEALTNGDQPLEQNPFDRFDPRTAKTPVAVTDAVDELELPISAGFTRCAQRLTDAQPPRVTTQCEFQSGSAGLAVVLPPLLVFGGGWLAAVALRRLRRSALAREGRLPTWLGIAAIVAMLLWPPFRVTQTTAPAERCGYHFVLTGPRDIDPYADEDIGARQRLCARFGTVDVPLLLAQWAAVAVVFLMIRLTPRMRAAAPEFVGSERGRKDERRRSATPDVGPFADDRDSAE